MLLARKDRFLFLADTLSGPDASAVELHYEQSLPLARGAALEVARETREARLLHVGRRRASVVPAALAEWRAEFCHGELRTEGGLLKLQQRSAGPRLCAPLWIDLDPARQRRPLTWRRLTVTENLQIVPRQVAAGWRIQAGSEQWLVYRSLAPVGNRSVLGHNTYASFVCSRFLASGKTQAIVEIE
jgi:hypothetical protein